MANTKQKEDKELQTRENERARLKKQGDIFDKLAKWSFLGALAGVVLMKFGDIEDASIGAYMVGVPMLICLVGVVVGIIGINTTKSKITAIFQAEQQENAYKLFSIHEEAKEAYDKMKKQLLMPAKPFHYQNKCLWISNQTLYLMDSESSYLSNFKSSDSHDTIKKSPVQFTSLPVGEIQYYTKEGDIQYTSKISGGGGGGSSIKGAVVGGVIAGDAGAIIGSRKKVEEIKTETEKHDSRKTVIRYFSNGTIQTLTFDGFSVYDFLLKNIPEKDLITIQLGQNRHNQVEISETSTKKKLQDLKDLYESGLIDDQEYKSKRSDLLNNL